jgi:DnaK suppressor protein
MATKKAAPASKATVPSPVSPARQASSTSPKNLAKTKATVAPKKVGKTTTQTTSLAKVAKAAKATTPVKATKAPSPTAKVAKAAKSTTPVKAVAAAKTATTAARAPSPTAKVAKAAKITTPVKAAAKTAATAAKAPSPARPVTPAPAPAKKVVGPYAGEPKFLDEQRVLLIEERGIYQGQAEDLRAEADSLALEREPGDVQFDEESGEGGTVAVDRERDLALSVQAAAAVEEIDDALRRIDRKSYGACERCHEAIPKARLRALPFARLCVACKSGGLSRR